MPALAAVAGPRPPFGVHSSDPVVQPVRCPAVRCPTRLVSAVRRPTVWCPPVWPVASRSSRVSTAVAMGTTPCGGHPSRPERVEFHVVPGGSVNGSSRPRRGRRCEGRPQVRSARRRCRSRSWPAVLGRRPRSTLTDQEARPPRGRAWLAAEPRTGAGGDAPFLCLSRGCPLGLDARPLSVVAVEPGAPGGRARKGQRA
jgi:hypothetical protein